MGEIIKGKNSGYAEYEELLLRRDKLKKECHILNGHYMKEFGDLITNVFEKKIECIKKKKTISYCMAQINRGFSIDQNELQNYIKEEMKEYERQLKIMIDDNDAAKNMTSIPEADVIKIKRIYRKLAKVIHPDINPKTEELDELGELWNRIVLSYNANDLKDLEEVEILVGRFLDDNDLSEIDLEIPNLDEKIEQIRKEIEEIRSKDPYTYKYLLEDPTAINEKKRELQSEFDEWENYEKELDQMMDSIVGKGVNITWRMN